MEDGLWGLVLTSGLDVGRLLYGRGFAASCFEEYGRMERSGREGSVFRRDDLPANLRQVLVEAIEGTILSNAGQD